MKRLRLAAKTFGQAARGRPNVAGVTEGAQVAQPMPMRKTSPGLVSRMECGPSVTRHSNGHAPLGRKLWRPGGAFAAAAAAARRPGELGRPAGHGADIWRGRAAMWGCGTRGVNNPPHSMRGTSLPRHATALRTCHGARQLSAGFGSFGGTLPTDLALGTGPAARRMLY